MKVKVELALAKMAESSEDRKPVDKRVRNAKGGDDEIRENAVEGVVLPHETKRVGSQGLRRPDETKRQGGQTLLTPSAETECSPSPDGTKRLGNGEGKGGGLTGGSGGMFQVLADGEGKDDFMGGTAKSNWKTMRR